MWGTSSIWTTIGSYEQAKSVYESTKPLRNNPNFRPLDRRSKDAKQSIRKENNNYIVVCYNTPVVTYKPDGSVVLRTGGYTSQTTAAAISASSPWPAWRKSNGLVVQLSASYSEANRYVIPREGLEVRADGTPVNPVVAKVQKKRVLRDKAKQARQVFAEVAKRIAVYQTAFAGGARPLDYATSVGQMYRFHALADLALTEEQIDRLAWYYVPNSHDYEYRTYKIRDGGKKSVDNLWRDVYDVFGVVEAYYVELPLGRVK
jgi:hypothetical protein